MENPTPFDLNEAIRRWRQDLGKSPAFQADNLEELASHLRASVQRLAATGLSEAEAFEIAVRRIGERGTLEREFCKVNVARALPLSTLLFWIVTALYLWQVGFAVVKGILAWSELMAGRAFQQFISGGASAQQIEGYVHSHPYNPHYLSSIAPSMTLVGALVLVFGARMACGNWNVGAFLRRLVCPIRMALCLVVAGLLITILPAFLPGLLSPIPSFHGRIWVPSNGMVGRAEANILLGLTMIVLAQLRLHNRSTDGGTPNNRATSRSR